MSHARLAHALFHEPWCLATAAYDTLREVYLAHIGSAATLDGRPIAARIRPESSFENDHGLGQGAAPAEKPPYTLIGSIAIVELRGVIAKRLTPFEESCYGGCSLERYLNAVEAAYGDSRVSKIIQHIDSPGGQAVGLEEGAKRLWTLAQDGQKELYAYTDTLCASAAYYLASQAHAVFAAPTARVGSIGTVVTLVDQTQLDARIGVKYTTFKSAPLKDLGNPHRAMTPEEGSEVQATVDHLNALFAAAVLRGRPEVSPEALQARVYFAPQALAAGLIDGIADSIEELLAALG